MKIQILPFDLILINLNELILKNQAYYQHNYEGSDGMPGFPIYSGRPQLDTRQGVYLGEHLNDGGVRNMIITVNGA